MNRERFIVGNKIELKAYGKINLGLDVLGIFPDGYHKVEMLMAQVSLADDVYVEVHHLYEKKDCEKNHKETSIELKLKGKEIIDDAENLAIIAARTFLKNKKITGNITIEIKKNIPIGAGMAGGSADCAAVLHALNVLTKDVGEGIPLEELVQMAGEIGSDVPFCVMGQIKGNNILTDFYEESSALSFFGLAVETGGVCIPVLSYNWKVLIVKPDFSVSTKEVYQGIDSEMSSPKLSRQRDKNFRFRRDATYNDTSEILNHRLDGRRNIEVFKIAQLIEEGKPVESIRFMGNILENFTEKKYTEITEIKDMIRKQKNAVSVLMTGSGPTVFALYDDEEKLMKDYKMMTSLYNEVYKTETLWDNIF